MSRITRAASYRRKNALKMSKGETALEAAFKEMDVEKITGAATVTLTRVPDLILVESGAISAALDVIIDVPSSAPQEFNRQCRVVNNDGVETITVKVKSGTGVAVATGAKKLLYIEDASAADSQIELT